MTEATALSIGLLLFPGMTQLDLTGPFEVFARLPGAKVRLVWKDLAPVVTDRGLAMLPDTILAECPRLDVLCVPGGPGTLALLEDAEVLGFCNRAADDRAWLTAVCTGALVLGAAGLLKGYRATTHWASHSLLALFGAIPEDARVVFDRDRVTGAGVTSGIDFALSLAARLKGEDVAREIQLQMEYAPQPPFSTGTPSQAGPNMVRVLSERTAALQEQRRTACKRAAAALGLG